MSDRINTNLLLLGAGVVGGLTLLNLGKRGAEIFFDGGVEAKNLLQRPQESIHFSELGTIEGVWNQVVYLSYEAGHATFFNFLYNNGKLGLAVPAVLFGKQPFSSIKEIGLSGVSGTVIFTYTITKVTVAWFRTGLSDAPKSIIGEAVFYGIDSGLSLASYITLNKALEMFEIIKGAMSGVQATAVITDGGVTFTSTNEAVLELLNDRGTALKKTIGQLRQFRSMMSGREIFVTGRETRFSLGQASYSFWLLFIWNSVQRRVTACLAGLALLGVVYIPQFRSGITGMFTKIYETSVFMSEYMSNKTATAYRVTAPHFAFTLSDVFAGLQYIYTYFSLSLEQLIEAQANFTKQKELDKKALQGFSRKLQEAEDPEETTELEDNIRIVQTTMYGIERMAEFIYDYIPKLKSTLVPYKDEQEMIDIMVNNFGTMEEWDNAKGEQDSVPQLPDTPENNDPDRPSTPEVPPVHHRDPPTPDFPDEPVEKEPVNPPNDPHNPELPKPKPPKISKTVTLDISKEGFEWFRPFFFDIVERRPDSVDRRITAKTSLVKIILDKLTSGEAWFMGILKDAINANTGRINTEFFLSNVGRNDDWDLALTQVETDLISEYNSESPNLVGFSGAEFFTGLGRRNYNFQGQMSEWLIRYKNLESITKDSKRFTPPFKGTEPFSLRKKLDRNAFWKQVEAYFFT